MSAVGRLFGGGAKAPTVIQQAAPTPAPTPAPPAPMPDANDPAVLEARRRQLAEASARGGRASTILSGTGADATGPGAGDYGSSTLG